MDKEERIIAKFGGARGNNHPERLVSLNETTCIVLELAPRAGYRIQPYLVERDPTPLPYSAAWKIAIHDDDSVECKGRAHSTPFNPSASSFFTVGAREAPSKRGGLVGLIAKSIKELSDDVARLRCIFTVRDYLAEQLHPSSHGVSQVSPRVIDTIPYDHIHAYEL